MREPEKFRRTDEYYNDQYDRDTISSMKEIEREMDAAEKSFHIDPNDLKSPENNTAYFSYRRKYLNTGVAYAREKRSVIEERMRMDDQKDRMINAQVIPSNIQCLVCGDDMQFELYDFLEKDTKMLMWFSCPQGHPPRRAFYGTGEEYKAPEDRCDGCGGSIQSSKKRTKTKLTFTEICKGCKKKTVIEFNISPKGMPPPIDETERKKYCIDFIGRRNFEEDLQSIADLPKIIEGQDAKGKYEFKNINKMNIAQLEEKLTNAIDKSGFVKIQFDKPKISRYLTVEFSVQDTQEREEAKSIKALKKLVDTTLFTTNWRLMSPGFEYRLGFLSGQLKGFSLDEDLLKIAQEIWRNK